MIDRLSNLINRNRSAAQISQVLCSKQHPLLGKDDLGNKEPHARRGRQLPWPQQVQSLFVVVPGMQHRGQGGPRPPD